jgi:ABC-type Mn2+/Zn2+ transport system permease subunit
MKEQGYAELILRFLRTVILLDTILTGVVGLIGLLLRWRTVMEYGNALTWTGMLVIFIAAFLGAGGLSARSGDLAAYTLSGAGNLSENIRHVAESRRSSLGCLFLMLVTGLGLIAIGYLLPVLSPFFG